MCRVCVPRPAWDRRFSYTPASALLASALVPEALRSEFPRFFADEFRNGGEHASFDGHLTMQLVVTVQTAQALYWEAKQDNSTSVAVDAPTRHSFAVDFRSRTTGDVEVDPLKFCRPQRAQVVGGVRNRDVEGLDATSCISQMWPGHGRSHAAPVSITPCAANGNAVTGECRRFRHISMLGVRILLTS